MWVINTVKMRKLPLILLCCLFVSGLFAQQSNNYWASLPAAKYASSANARNMTEMPSEFQLFSLDEPRLLEVLSKAPMEFTIEADRSPVQVELPTASGDFRSFRLVESPVMAPELSAKFPMIKTYAGTALDGSGAIVRLGVGPYGFHAFIFEQDGRANAVTSFEPGSTAPVYMAYEQGKMPNFQVRCGTEDGHTEHIDMARPTLEPSKGAQDRGAGPPVTLKRYRLAVAAKAEYSNFISPSGDTATIIAAIVTAVNYIAAIKERDLNVRFELVPNLERLVFLVPSADPYTGNLVSDWMDQNVDVLNDRIGGNNYDIGHIFGKFVTGSAVGVAIPGSTCNLNLKAKGSSSENSPNNTRFYLVAAHEMCHQLNGRHTWSNCSTDSQTQLNAPTAFEPGSGSTVMGYPGACGTNDIQGNNDAYYHASSIAETKLFMTQGNGRLCGTTITTTNNAPDVSIPLGAGVVIPRSTPFELTAQASDPDGHPLTYCWEQMDLGPTSVLGQPSGNAPAFRSFPPVTSPTRSFPRITTVLAGSANKNEVLPTYARDFNFRVTVRDNQSGGGGINSANVKFSATADAGPFRVTSQNGSNLTWRVGEYQEISWDVAKTDLPPVNCSKVNILLSVTGGTDGTFPIVLATDVPNTGRACVLVPKVRTATGRIKVEAANNIFYNTSRSNVSIDTVATAGFSVCAPISTARVCLPQPFVADLTMFARSGFSSPVQLSATGLPTGVTARFEPNPVAPGATAQMILSYSGNVAEATQTVTIRGTAGNITDETTIALTYVSNNFSSLALTAPADGSLSAGQTPTLTWVTAADATSYEIQVAESPTFEAATIKISQSGLTTGSFAVTAPLEKAKRYFWRVRPVSECGPANWTDPYVFATTLDACTTVTSTDIPKQITLGLNTVESKITVNDSGVLSDVNVLQMKGNHTSFNDLAARLIAPDGTNTVLFANRCGAVNSNFDLGFDNNAGVTAFPCPPPSNSTVIKPSGNLDLLNGKDAKGTWILRVADNTSGGGGNLTGFALQLCFAKQVEPPVLVNNNVLKLVVGNSASIATPLLQAQDNQSGPADLKFTVTALPKSGELRLNGVLLKAGDQFTQTDIDQGKIAYTNTGNNSGDYFKFIVADPDGGYVVGTFKIELSVAAFEPNQSIAFRLSPNPAVDRLRLDFSEILPSDTRVTLVNAAGQQVRQWTLVSGQNTAQLDLAQLPSGVYALSLENNQGKAAKKVVIRY